MKLFNTLTNKKEEFKPLKEGEVVFMYVDLQFITMFILEIQDQ